MPPFTLEDRQNNSGGNNPRLAGARNNNGGSLFNGGRGQSDRDRERGGGSLLSGKSNLNVIPPYFLNTRRIIQDEGVLTLEDLIKRKLKDSQDPAPPLLNETNTAPKAETQHSSGIINTGNGADGKTQPGNTASVKKLHEAESVIPAQTTELAGGTEKINQAIMQLIENEQGGQVPGAAFGFGGGSGVLDQSRLLAPRAPAPRPVNRIADQREPAKPAGRLEKRLLGKQNNFDDAVHQILLNQSNKDVPGLGFGTLEDDRNAAIMKSVNDKIASDERRRASETLQAGRDTAAQIKQDELRRAGQSAGLVKQDTPAFIQKLLDSNEGPKHDVMEGFKRIGRNNMIAADNAAIAAEEARTDLGTDEGLRNTQTDLIDSLLNRGSPAEDALAASLDLSNTGLLSQLGGQGGGATSALMLQNAANVGGDIANLRSENLREAFNLAGDVRAEDRTQAESAANILGTEATTRGTDATTARTEAATARDVGTLESDIALTTAQTNLMDTNADVTSRRQSLDELNAVLLNPSSTPEEVAAATGMLTDAAGLPADLPTSTAIDRYTDWLRDDLGVPEAEIPGLVASWRENQLGVDENFEPIIDANTDAYGEALDNPGSQTTRENLVSDDADTRRDTASGIAANIQASGNTSLINNTDPATNAAYDYLLNDPGALTQQWGNGGKYNSNTIAADNVTFLTPPPAVDSVINYAGRLVQVTSDVEWEYDTGGDAEYQYITVRDISTNTTYKIAPSGKNIDSYRMTESGFLSSGTSGKLDTKTDIKLDDLTDSSFGSPGEDTSTAAILAELRETNPLFRNI